MELIACPSGPHASKVFVRMGGRRHHVPDAQRAKANGFSLAKTRTVSEEELAALTPGGSVPNRWSPAHWNAPPRDSILTMREIAASKLRGEGVEFGPGINPFPVPLECRVRYADRVPPHEFVRSYGFGEAAESVPLDLITGMEEMRGLDDGALDFIVACHVIEHVRSPLAAFRNAYAKLRAGGQLVLVVPDKTFTFDKGRQLTSLEHIIADFKNPSRSRDFEHYVEWYEKAFPVQTEYLHALASQALEEGRDIHFHVWLYETFVEMVQYSRSAVSPWAEVWSQPTLVIEGANEFYLVLTKPSSRLQNHIVQV